MRKLLCALAFYCAVSATGCKKDDPAFSGAKVITASDLKAGFVDTYSYNGEGNVAMITNNSGERTVFTYAGDTVTMEYVLSTNVVASATIYLLNGDNYADTSYGLYQAQNSSARYSYDGNGQLTQQKNYAYGTVTATTDVTLTNKNATTQITTNATSGAQTRFEYSYTTTTNTIGNQNFGKGFLGVGSLYLPQTRVQLTQAGDTVEVLTYRYGLDDNSRVGLKTSYNAAGVLVDSIAYGY